MDLNGQAAKVVIDEVKKAVVGKDDCIELVLCALLARGHILIEDIPGVGKTTLALAFAKAIAMEEKRMQFTPDVLPTDVLGFSLYDKENGQFQFQPGPIMTNLFLADEINRTSPKTQSALLEVMEEGTVTVDGITRKVPQPFLVLATQNPIGSAGTSMLPESQLDRFMIRMTMGYPNIENEIEILKGKHARNPLDEINQVLTIEEVLKMQVMVDEIFIHDLIYEYIANLVQLTRQNPMIQLGISPRGTLAIVKMARARAFIKGRDYVIPDDVVDIFAFVVNHRILLSPKARINHITLEKVIDNILNAVDKPSARE